MTTSIKDFSYLDQGFFTVFIPNTKESEAAWNELASITDGTGKVPTIQAKQFIYQLKKAGYTVGKAKKPTTSIDDILLDDLFAELEVVVEEPKEESVEEVQTITTEQTIVATRQWFADNAQACIDQAVSGQLRVNDLATYVVYQTQRIQDCLLGKWDHTLSFQQRVVFIQTGKCYALLP